MIHIHFSHGSNIKIVKNSKLMTLKAAQRNILQQRKLPHINWQLFFNIVFPDWITEGSYSLKSPIFKIKTVWTTEYMASNGGFCHLFFDLVDFWRLNLNLKYPQFLNTLLSSVPVSEGICYLHLWRKSKEVKVGWSWKQLSTAIFVEDPFLGNKLKAISTLQSNTLSWITWLSCWVVKARSP